MNTLAMVFVSAIWVILIIVTSLLSLFSTKLKIPRNYVIYSWEILKYVTIAIIGYLLGAGTGGTNGA